MCLWQGQDYVLQEFVNHGGVLFKIYVLGSRSILVKRLSYPDCDTAEISQSVEPLKVSTFLLYIGFERRYNKCRTGPIFYIVMDKSGPRESVWLQP